MENSKSGRKTILAAVLLLLVIYLFFFHPSFDKMLIALFVGLAYFTGLISIFFSVIFSILAFLAALPVISTFQAYVAFILARINYIVFRVFVGKVLRRVGFYRKVEMQVKKSPIVKRAGKIFHGLLRDLGLERPRRVRVFEVTECGKCRRDVPVDGVMCPYCGAKVEIDPKSWRGIFQAQFEDFHSHIENLANLEELRRLSNYPGHRHFGRNAGRLRHSYLTAWLSYKLASRLDLDVGIAARAGLLHDIGYTPRGPGALNQMLHHARRASIKISGMDEDRQISEMVHRHMFPLGRPPTSAESWVLWVADKTAFILEFFRAETLFQGDELWKKIDI
ncbi:MAG: HD domain-containing protein [Candidatus Hydrothermarchaeaceae archaeon]